MLILINLAYPPLYSDNGLKIITNYIEITHYYASKTIKQIKTLPNT